MPTSTKTAVPTKRTKNAKTATPPTPKPTAPVTPAAPASTPPALPPAALTVASLLSAETGASIAELAEKAGLSRTTASKALTALESAGTARREDGGRAGVHRAPDRWFATARADDAAPPVDVVAEPEPVTETSGEPEAQADSDDATPPVEAAAEPEPVSEASGEPEALADSQPEFSDGELDVPSDGPVQDEPVPATPAEPANAPDPQPTASAATLPAKPAKKTPVTPAATVTAPTGEERRLPKGGLRTMVAEHLESNPELVITASKLGKLLDRSSGAVANALDKLIELGAVEQVGDKPRTFRHRAPNAAA